ncbi:12223_t:CDS:2 [Ambispora leptoticha]|uniref:12223_t:CDS:1 n=1 Tax=Ambispora leptoticha TaxID=144679 RepID=A0A9N9FQU9_9GLOM|nr:12223_t:CDS:2 [Ambispora leptoticha]
MSGLQNKDITESQKEQDENVPEEEKEKLINIDYKTTISLTNRINNTIALVQRVESVKQDYDQKQAGNQILQTYINNLMTSNVLSSAGAGAVSGGIGKKDG